MLSHSLISEVTTSSTFHRCCFLQVVRCLLIEPYPESALNEDAGKLLLEDYEAYAKHARLFTSIHAPSSAAAGVSMSRSKSMPQHAASQPGQQSQPGQHPSCPHHTLRQSVSASDHLAPGAASAAAAAAAAAVAEMAGSTAAAAAAAVSVSPSALAAGGAGGGSAPLAPNRSIANADVQREEGVGVAAGGSTGGLRSAGSTLALSRARSSSSRLRPPPAAPPPPSAAHSTRDGARQGSRQQIAGQCVGQVVGQCVEQWAFRCPGRSQVGSQVPQSLSGAPQVPQSLSGGLSGGPFALRCPSRSQVCCQVPQSLSVSLVSILSVHLHFAPMLSPPSEDDRKPRRIQKPKTPAAEKCLRKCVGTCIRGGAGAPGEGPINVERPIVVFKSEFRSRQYCLVECSEICNLLSDAKSKP
ncbi:unnamed protein product [Closterium sp. NIES-65]|nr:unnamed protein product [Closterium sp. NIES-65]